MCGVLVCTSGRMSWRRKKPHSWPLLQVLFLSKLSRILPSSSRPRWLGATPGRSVSWGVFQSMPHRSVTRKSGGSGVEEGGWHVKVRTSVVQLLPPAHMPCFTGRSSALQLEMET